MGDFQTVYDARSMGAADHSMILVAILGVLISSAGAALGWLRLRSTPKRDRRADPWRTINPVLAVTAMALALTGYLAFAFIEDRLWASDYASHRYEVLDGCVRNFGETVEADHDLATDTFTLNGRDFRLSDSGWRLGYHVSHHHGSPIQENAHLRVFANGPRLLKIDISSTGC